jgi:mRNA-degrading endonuclease toxin of MazEF toxin-antitoxin module
VGIPITTSLKGGAFRVMLRRGVGGLAQGSEVACEQIVQGPKRNFLSDQRGVVRPLGGRLEDALLEAVVNAVVSVISA